MKTLCLFALIAGLSPVSYSNAATAHRNETFVPTQCGIQTYSKNANVPPSLVEVCFGQETGQNALMVEFTFVDESTQLFRVVSTANLLVYLTSGDTIDVLILTGANNDQAAMNVVRDHAGAIVSAVGTLGETHFVVPDVKTVTTPM